MTKQVAGIAQTAIKKRGGSGGSTNIDTAPEIDKAEVDRAAAKRRWEDVHGMPWSESPAGKAAAKTAA